jgi:hypothetical protein
MEGACREAEPSFPGVGIDVEKARLEIGDFQCRLDLYGPVVVLRAVADEEGGHRGSDSANRPWKGT